MAADPTRDADPAARLMRLRDEVLAALQQRDLARDAEERGDGHHHPAEAATDADLRAQRLRTRLARASTRDRHWSTGRSAPSSPVSCRTPKRIWPGGSWTRPRSVPRPSCRISASRPSMHAPWPVS